MINFPRPEVIVQVHGRSYVVRLPNGIEVSKLWPFEIHRLGKLTADDHAAGQYDLHDRVQVLVNGKWMEGEIRGQNNVNMYDIKVPGVDTMAATITLRTHNHCSSWRSL
jgi:hypothetical protein